MNKTLPLGRAPLKPPAWWLKWRPLRWLLVLALGAWLYGTWHGRRVEIPTHPDNDAFQARAPVRLPFLDGLSSYDTVQETRFLLANQRATHTETSRAYARSPRYPDYRLVTVRVPRYTARISAGPLTLVYFNDRLLRATFEPDSPDLLARDLERRYPALQPDADGRALLVDGPLRITTDVLAGGPGRAGVGPRAFITWEDLRLVRQLSAWDTRFGEAARRPPSLLQP